MAFKALLVGEQKSPKNSHLMIFMRALLTDGVRVWQVKAYHTELGYYLSLHGSYIDPRLQNTPDLNLGQC